MVSLVTSRATARVCSTTTDWLTSLRPPVSWPSEAVPRATPRPTRTASAKSRSDNTSGQVGRRRGLSATVGHRGFDLADLPGGPAQPFDPGTGDGVVVLDPDAGVIEPLDGRPHPGDH